MVFCASSINSFLLDDRKDIWSVRNILHRVQRFTFGSHVQRSGL